MYACLGELVDVENVLELDLNALLYFTYMVHTHAYFYSCLVTSLIRIDMHYGLTHVWYRI